MEHGILYLKYRTEQSVNGWSGASFSGHGILTSDGQALEQGCCFSAVFCDAGDMHACACVSSVAMSCHVPAVLLAEG